MRQYDQYEGYPHCGYSYAVVTSEHFPFEAMEKLEPTTYTKTSLISGEQSHTRVLYSMTTVVGKQGDEYLYTFDKSENKLAMMNQFPDIIVADNPFGPDHADVAYQQGYQDALLSMKVSNKPFPSAKYYIAAAIMFLLAGTLGAKVITTFIEGTSLSVFKWWVMPVILIAGPISLLCGWRGWKLDQET